MDDRFWTSGQSCEKYSGKTTKYMNILTFDIEDWYNCDFISGNFDWDKYEVRIYEGLIGY